MAEPAEVLLTRIEDASLNASAPRQQRWLDGWILRYCPGKARRARCINAVAAGRLPLQQKLELSQALFDAAGLPMVIRVTRFTQPADLDRQLDALGWRKLDTTRVQFRRDLGNVQPPPMPAGTHWARLAPAAYAEAVGEMRCSSAEHRLTHAERLAVSPIPYEGYAICRDSDGDVLACGQTAQEAELVGIYDVHTRESARNQGLARLLCERLLSQSAANGAEIAYLQVEASNAAALRVYRWLGFEDGYTYHYRERGEG